MLRYKKRYFHFPKAYFRISTTVFSLLRKPNNRFFVKRTVTKTKCSAKALANFFFFSKGKRNYTTDEVIAAILNESDIQFSDSDDDIQEDFAASSSEKDGKAIESVPVNKDTVLTKETASKKRRVIWHKTKFDKPNFTWLHDHTIADAHTVIDQTSPMNFTHQIYNLLEEQANQRYLKKLEMNLILHLLK